MTVVTLVSTASLPKLEGCELFVNDPDIFRQAALLLSCIGGEYIGNIGFNFIVSLETFCSGGKMLKVFNFSAELTLSNSGMYFDICSVLILFSL